MKIATTFNDYFTETVTSFKWTGNIASLANNLHIRKNWCAGFSNRFSSSAYIQVIKLIAFWFLAQSYHLIPVFLVGCNVDITFSFVRFVFQSRPEHNCFFQFFIQMRLMITPNDFFLLRSVLIFKTYVKIYSETL